MNRRGVAIVLLASCVPMLGVAGCGQDPVQTTGTNSLTVQVNGLVGAKGSQLTAELSKGVDYGQTAPTWTVISTTVTSSPFASSGSVEQLPEGEFGLVVLAGSAGKSEVEQVKGQGCEMTVVLGRDEQVTIAIDGLNQFGAKGYGECAASITR